MAVEAAAVAEATAATEEGEAELAAMAVALGAKRVGVDLAVEGCRGSLAPPGA